MTKSAAGPRHHLAKVHSAPALQHGLDEVLVAHGHAAWAAAEVPQSARSGLHKAALEPRGSQSPPPVVSSTSTPEVMASSNLASTCTLAWVWARPPERLRRHSAKPCQPGGRWQASNGACASGAGRRTPGRPRPQRCPSRLRSLRRPGRLLPAWRGSRRVSGRAPASVYWAQQARRLWTGRPRMAACPPAAAPSKRGHAHTYTRCARLPMQC